MREFEKGDVLHKYYWSKARGFYHRECKILAVERHMYHIEEIIPEGKNHVDYMCLSNYYQKVYRAAGLMIFITDHDDEMLAVKAFCTYLHKKYLDKMKEAERAYDTYVDMVHLLAKHVNNESIVSKILDIRENTNS